LERMILTYKEYWGYHWRIINRHHLPGIFKWDEQLVELIEKVCRLKPGSEVLDLGCGGGDQAKVFAQKNYPITGIDNVPSLIEYARKAFEKEDLQGEFLVADMRLIRYESRFDLVTMLSGTFGFFSDEQNKKLLQRIHRALKPGGFAFLDYLSLERFASAGHARNWHHIDGGYALSESWFDVPTSTHRSRNMHILLDGRIIEGADEEGYGANEVVRCYTAREIVALAESVGFTVTAHLTRNHIGNPDYKALDGEPRGMIVICKNE
jgi:ubiquinone/menaquinone biosynthesis C-methylase UbiE